MVVDSGATLTLLRQKDKKWLRRLDARIRAATVRTATGEATKTRGAGPLCIYAEDKEGVMQRLDSMGNGQVLPGLTFPLLSVSELNDNGCEVFFKPKNAYMITPNGHTIPFTQEDGLFFLQTGEKKERSTNATQKCGKAYVVHEESSTTRSRRVKRRVKDTMKVLKSARYSCGMGAHLHLRGMALLSTVCAAEARAKLSRAKLRVKHHHGKVEELRRARAFVVTRSQMRKNTAESTGDSTEGVQDTSTPRRSTRGRIGSKKRPRQGRRNLMGCACRNLA